MNAYLGDFQLAPVFDEADVEHYLMPVTDVVDSHVVEDPNAPGVGEGTVSVVWSGGGEG